MNSRRQTFSSSQTYAAWGVPPCLSVCVHMRARCGVEGRERAAAGLFVGLRALRLSWQPPSVRRSAAFQHTSLLLFNELGSGKSYSHTLTSTHTHTPLMNMHQDCFGPEESQYQWAAHNGRRSHSVSTPCSVCLCRCCIQKTRPGCISIFIFFTALQATHTGAARMCVCVLKQQPKQEISVMGWLC